MNEVQPSTLPDPMDTNCYDQNGDLKGKPNSLIHGSQISRLFYLRIIPDKIPTGITKNFTGLSQPNYPHPPKKCSSDQRSYFQPREFQIEDIIA